MQYTPLFTEYYSTLVGSEKHVFLFLQYMLFTALYYICSMCVAAAADGSPYVCVYEGDVSFLIFNVNPSSQAQ